MRDPTVWIPHIRIPPDDRGDAAAAGSRGGVNDLATGR